MEVSSLKKMNPFILIGASFLFIQIASVSLMAIPAIGASPPLQKVQLKIEGIHKNSLFQKVGSFFCGFTVSTDCGEQDIPLMLQRIETHLLSVPGVKTVEIRIKKKWFFFKDYNKVYAIVEFELGTLTSETLVLAAESASDAKHIYKVKFVE
ncbi:MAG: hypothetical protein HY037_00020 [Nitrospirae bacterium]|nr:hypothetical protein [Candidatus Troglogloeales bacterium]